MSSTKVKVPAASTRQWPRYTHLKDVSLSYEGRSEVLAVHLPDISPTGMFLNTKSNFPEGTVLKVSFHLSRSNHAIQVRGEVRYCLSGVGVGLEFIDISPEDVQAIMNELKLPAKKRKRLKEVATSK